MNTSAFKFLNQENAEKLLIKGNIYIPAMHGFADKSKYSGSVYDNEGFVEIINQYSQITVDECNYYGSANNPDFKHTYKGERFTNLTFKVNCSSAPANIYCTTSHFFSETLDFAVEKGNDHCVFICDIEKFNLIAQQNIPYAKYITTKPCDYIGREINEIDPMYDSVSESILQDLSRIFFIKPKVHANQNELRSLWQNLDFSDKLISECIPELKPLCIEIKFPTVFEYIKNGGKIQDGNIIALLHYTKSKVVTAYLTNNDNAVYSPKIIEMNSKKELWFEFLPINGQAIHIENMYSRALSGSNDMGPYPANDLEFIEFVVQG